MSQTTVYNWLKSNRVLAAHLPLNDDVSGMSDGGTLVLIDTEGYVAPTLYHTSGAALPINIPGPIPGSSGIYCDNTGKYNIAVEAYAHAATSMVPEDSSWSIGCWIATYNAWSTGFGDMEVVWNLGPESGNQKGLFWKDYNLSNVAGPAAIVRPSLGTGTQAVAEPASSLAELTWHFAVVTLDFQTTFSTLRLYLNGELADTVVIDAGDDGAWSTGAFYLWGLPFAAQTTTPDVQCGFRGAIWDWWITHDAIDSHNARWLYREYLDRNPNPALLDETDFHMTNTATIASIDAANQITIAYTNPAGVAPQILRGQRLVFTSGRLNSWRTWITDARDTVSGVQLTLDNDLPARPAIGDGVETGFVAGEQMPASIGR